MPTGALDRFRLAGVVAGWWSDSLPDLKTLMEQGFAGVIDGWIDAIDDALNNDEDAAPLFDPFAHKLVQAKMTDYLERIADEKAAIARIKAEKEAWETQNPPEEEEEAEGWNYAKDLECRIKEAKADIKPDIKRLKELDKALDKSSFPQPSPKGRGVKSSPLLAGEGLGVRAAERVALLERIQPTLNRIAELEAELAPYEILKADLAAARLCYRELIGQFLTELQSRCRAMDDAEEQALVLDLLEKDLLAGLETAANRERQGLVRLVENLWDKYRVTLVDVRRERADSENRLERCLTVLGYQ